jgi:signal transduction histidine kinase
MKLSTRVSLFFLAWLAVTLAGFSLGLYLLVGRHLRHEVDQHLRGALATLTAAVEIKKDGVEWEPHQRRLLVSTGEVRWLVRDERGRTVRGSQDDIPAEVLAQADRRGAEFDLADLAAPQRWRTAQVRLVPDSSIPVKKGEQRSDDQQGGPDEFKYAALVVTVAAPLGPVEDTLSSLAAALGGLSLVVWLAAALTGRWLCQRMLAPISHMADSARSISASEPASRLAVARSGDELEELGRSFNGLLDRLQEAFERQRRFTGEASHQLRTPVAVLLGQVEVALRRDRPAEEYRRVLGVVAEQAGRLQRIVEMLLFLARADAEAALPGLAPLEVRPWLEEHLRTWRDHPRAAAIHLAAGDGSVCALAHAPLLGQVVDILLDNACKYSPPGSPITVSLAGSDGHILLSVEDAGRGIDPDDLPRVFEPFFRSPRLAGAEGGVGLGLAIARRVTAAMGGTVEAQSEPGRGSRFVVALQSSSSS